MELLERVVGFLQQTTKITFDVTRTAYPAHFTHGQMEVLGGSKIPF